MNNFLEKCKSTELPQCDVESLSRTVSVEVTETAAPSLHSGHPMTPLQACSHAG